MVPQHDNKLRAETYNKRIEYVLIISNWSCNRVAIHLFLADHVEVLPLILLVYSLWFRIINVWIYSFKGKIKRVKIWNRDLVFLSCCYVPQGHLFIDQAYITQGVGRTKRCKSYIVIFFHFFLSLPLSLCKFVIWNYKDKEKKNRIMMKMKNKLKSWKGNVERWIKRHEIGEEI